MSTSPNIQFLRNDQIDKARWDECIAASLYGLIYANTFYLDNMAAGWNALVGDDYQWVMPLTSRRKYGLSYLYQPSFTQQSGAFAKNSVKVPYSEIVHYLRQHYQFCEINWNFGARELINTLPLQVFVATNYILDLSTNYDHVAANYQGTLTRNLKRCRHFEHHYQSHQDYEKCIRLYREYYGARMPHLTQWDYRNFSNTCIHAVANNLLVCRDVVDPNGTLMATVLLLGDGKRLYNIMNVTTLPGKRTGANHFLLNSLIQEYAGSGLLLDFEGSDLPGVKNFYSKFGSTNQPYFRCRFNRIPWPFNYLKK